MLQQPLTAQSRPRRNGAGSGVSDGSRSGLAALRSVTLERRELPVALNPLAVFAAAGTLQRVYWSAPDDDVEFCAIGSAFEIETAAGPHRFDDACAALRLVEVTVTGDENGGGQADAALGPLLVGGFAFSDSEAAAADADWAAFGGGRLTLPEILVTRIGGRTWLTATPGANLWPVVAASRHSETGQSGACATCGMSSDGTACGLAETTACAEPNDISDVGEGTETCGRDIDPVVRDTELDNGAIAQRDGDSICAAAAGYQVDDAYAALVERALEAISTGDLDKVVTARELRLAAHVEPVAVLDRLVQRYPMCVTFAFGHGERTFFGATPERLVRSDGQRVHTDALAGSRPRDRDPVRDAELAAELTSDPKERAEHFMVVSDVQCALTAAGVTLDAPAPTGVMPLRRIAHLHTPISGQLDEPATLLELARALHPTAAVAGLPRRAALDWIDRHEDIDRGWYAGPIGWTTPDGRGEFRVALRCALAGPQEATLFAGAGIVSGAVAHDELAETATKLEALLCALDGD